MLRNLLSRHAAKEAQLDDPGVPLVELSEFGERDLAHIDTGFALRAVPEGSTGALEGAKVFVDNLYLSAG